jgi:hypothetical protein
MASKKISQLNELTTAAGEDLLAIVDDPTGSPETKKIKAANLFASMLPPCLAKYLLAAGQTIPHNAWTVINFETNVYDPLNLVTIGANWKFTSPASGYYAVSGMVQLTASTAWSPSEAVTIVVHVNDAPIGVRLAQVNNYNTSGGALPISVFIPTHIVQLNAGDYLNLLIHQNSGGDQAIINNGIYNHINIWRIA